MTTYKFLARGGRGPFSGNAWPLPAGDAPGAWIEVVGPLAPCARGVHVCRAFELAHWLHDELWQVDTDGNRLEMPDCMVVQRARLLRRIDSWSSGGAARFAEACIGHAVALAGSAPGAAVREFLDDAKLAASAGYVAVAAFTSAFAVAKLDAGHEDAGAYRRERAWQSDWIARELIAA